MPPSISSVSISSHSHTPIVKKNPAKAVMVCVHFLHQKRFPYKMTGSVNQGNVSTLLLSPLTLSKGNWICAQLSMCFFQFIPWIADFSHLQSMKILFNLHNYLSIDLCHYYWQCVFFLFFMLFGHLFSKMSKHLLIRHKGLDVPVQV